MGATQGRRWCFTLNNPTDAEQVQDLWGDWPRVQGGICQLEQGENGTPHYQGYVVFTGSTRLTAVKKLLDRAHWEVARGDGADNKKYCSKEEGRLQGPWSFGDLADKERQRSDWISLQKDVEGGATDRELAINHFRLYVCNRNGIDAIRRLFQPERNYRTELIVLVGPPGSGKSWLAEQLGGEDCYWHQGGQWWDDYSGQRVAVLEEFRGTIPFRQLLVLADRYPCKVEIKGGMRNFVSHTLIITSNIRPEGWYDSTKPGITPEAIYRRISQFVYLSRDEDECFHSVGYTPRLY